MTDDWQIHGEERPLPALLGELKERAIEELHARLGDEPVAELRKTTEAILASELAPAAT